MELKHVSGFITSTQADLLIVPYGIETFYRYHIRHLFLTFNRTLWN